MAATVFGGAHDPYDIPEDMRRVSNETKTPAVTDEILSKAAVEKYSQKKGE